MRHTLLAAICALPIFMSSPSALAAAAGPEIVFCAAMAAYPAADKERGGFDVEIAEVLAAELGATASFLWTNFDDVGMRDTLHSGLCDAAIGVTEGLANVLTTVAYLNAPFAFVTRTDAGVSVQDLDDPQLRELRIGTYQSGLPSVALRNREITENVTEYAAIVRPQGIDPNTPILDALMRGDVDVAIVYGPAAAGRALEEPGAVTVAAVTPEIDFGARLLPLTRILTIGVRQHDEALRDDLNRALALRWDDVLAILDRYLVPQASISKPHASPTNAAADRVGVIYPAGTPAALPNAAVGEEARRGAKVAENALSLAAPTEQVQVMTAHAPSLDAVKRAALRLILVDQVDAIVGGFDAAEARAIGHLAGVHGVPFFNVAAADDSLRSAACYPTSLHLSPSSAMMAAASTSLRSDADVFVVFEEGSVALSSLPDLTRVIEEAGGRIVGQAVVEKGQYVFYPVIARIAASGAGTAQLYLTPDSQEALLSQAGALDPGIDLIGVSEPGGQTREYLKRYLQIAPALAVQPRVVAWDPALPTQINAAFTARTGEPMESVGWATYAGIMVASEAVRAGATGDAATVKAFLSDPASLPDLGVGPGTHFRAEDGQIVRDLIVVQPEPLAPWGRSAQARIATASVVGSVPMSVTQHVSVRLAPECDR